MYEELSVHMNHFVVFGKGVDIMYCVAGGARSQWSARRASHVCAPLSTEHRSVLGDRAVAAAPVYAGAVLPAA